MPITTEVVIYNIESALNAQRGGADRVELCDNSGDGGTTPSSGVIRVLQSLLSIPLFVMIRPRGGDFYYSAHEFEAMKHDIHQAKELGADGVVFGILDKDGTIDKRRCGELIELAEPLPVTFHRAFDMTRDPYTALQDCIDLGFNRILTSGQQPTAMKGIPLIAKLVQKAANKITIMAGSGINEDTISPVVRKTKVKEIHFSARTKRSSQMEFINDNIMGMGATKGQEYEIKTASVKKIQELKVWGQQAISDH